MTGDRSKRDGVSNGVQSEGNLAFNPHLVGIVQRRVDAASGRA